VFVEELCRFLDQERSQMSLDGSIHPLFEVMFVAGDQVVSAGKNCGGEDWRVLCMEGDPARQEGSGNVGNQVSLFQQVSEAYGMNFAHAVAFCSSTT
jgi:hypothetical protein